MGYKNIFGRKFRLSFTLAFIPFFFCCGANEPVKKKVEETSSAVQVDKTEMSPDKIFPQQKPDLDQNRYTQEMISDEINNSYAGSGEYIDPEKVISLVRGSEYQPVPEATLNLDLPARVEQDKLVATKTWRISQLTHEEAFKLFLAGDYRGAADKWKELATDARAFTISIEIDCDQDLLKKSYDKLIDLEMPVFIQTANVKGRSCFRLCAGVFAKMDEASPYISLISQRLEGSFPFTTALNK